MIYYSILGVALLLFSACKNANSNVGASSPKSKKTQTAEKVKVGMTRSNLEKIEGYEGVSLRFERHGESIESLSIGGVIYQVKFTAPVHGVAQGSDKVLSYKKRTNQP